MSGEAMEIPPPEFTAGFDAGIDFALKGLTRSKQIGKFDAWKNFQLQFPTPEPEGLDLEAAGMRSCPFCGQRGATILLPHPRVGCWSSKCVAFVADSSRYYWTEEEAIAAWNGRRLRAGAEGGGNHG